MAVVGLCRNVIDNMGAARYGEDENKQSEFIVYWRNVMINLIGNFVLENTDYSQDDALQSNIDSILSDLKDFFEKVRIQLSEKELAS
jgi:hypothetical protein